MNVKKLSLILIVNFMVVSLMASTITVFSFGFCKKSDGEFLTGMEVKVSSSDSNVATVSPTTCITSNNGRIDVYITPKENGRCNIVLKWEVDEFEFEHTFVITVKDGDEGKVIESSLLPGYIYLIRVDV